MCALVALCVGYAGNEDADGRRLADVLRFSKPVPYPDQLPKTRMKERATT